jgi:hypothetical protein
LKEIKPQGGETDKKMDGCLVSTSPFNTLGTMARIYKNGEVAIRVKDIVAVHIPSDDDKIVEICTTYALASFRFRCKSNESAKSLWQEISDEMVKEL